MLEAARSGFRKTSSVGHSPSVLVDATSLPPNWGGVARYIEGVLGGLAELGETVDVVVKPDDLERLRASAPGHRYHAGPATLRYRPVRFAWEQIGLPALARRLGSDVIHSPHYTFPLVTRRRTAVTLHDATFFSDPAAHSLLKRTFFGWWIRRAAARADATITPSRATADAVREATGSSPDVTVAYLGVDARTFRPPEPAEVERFAADRGLTETGWIAFLGTIEPRKNVPALLRAYGILRRRRAASGQSTPSLVLSGARGWDEEAARLLDAAGPGDGVIEAGYLPLDDLHVLLGGSAVTVYPSLGEGFGLPVLEAMACGATVLTTRRLSIPEVGGDAVAYAEPDDASLSDALDALLDDSAERRRLGALALERAGDFTWRRCAETHVEAYATAGGHR